MRLPLAALGDGVAATRFAPSARRRTVGAGLSGLSGLVCESIPILLAAVSCVVVFVRTVRVRARTVPATGYASDRYGIFVVLSSCNLRKLYEQANKDHSNIFRYYFRNLIPIPTLYYWIHNSLFNTSVRSTRILSCTVHYTPYEPRIRLVYEIALVYKPSTATSLVYELGASYKTRIKKLNWARA